MKIITLLLSFVTVIMAFDCSLYNTQKETCLSHCCIYCNTSNICTYKSNVKDNDICSDNNETWILSTYTNCINDENENKKANSIFVIVLISISLSLLCCALIALIIFLYQRKKRLTLVNINEKMNLI